MSKIWEMYKKIRNKDRKLIGTLPIDNRIILGKIITDSGVDSELKYVWVNRAVAQVSSHNTTTILRLNETEPLEQKIARNMTLKLREYNKLPIPFEIGNSYEFESFIDRYNEEYIIIKQNYPNYSNEEMQKLKEYDFKNKKVVYANSEVGNKIIGANESLEKIGRKDSEWMKKNIGKYLTDFYNRSDLMICNEDLDMMVNFVKKLLIPSTLYKGNMSGLREEIQRLISQKFLPVLKFIDSISGYGVHYPKDKNGEYNLSEIEDAIKSDRKFERYLVSSLCKNGQKINKEYLEEVIEKQGIILQKYIDGKDYAIGFFKPLEIYNNNFSLGIIDLDISDVLTSGTAHYGDVLHYENDFIKKILEKTIFCGEPELIFLTIEIIIYLLCINEKIINNPKEFKEFNFEDFGIQLMINDVTGEIGLIEINGRTPSHNFNHFNLLSIYGEDFLNSVKIPSKKVLCTNVKIADKDDFINLVKDEKNKIHLIEDLNLNIVRKFENKCQLVCFQAVKKYFYIYYAYYLDENEKEEIIIEHMEKFCRKYMEKFH